MPRFLSRSVQFGLDCLVLSVAFWLSFLFRFEFQFPSPWSQIALMSWPYALIIQYSVLLAFGIPLLSWRYLGLRETRRICYAVITSCIVMVGARLAISALGSTVRLGALPLGMIGMNMCLTFVGLVGIRAARRLYGEAQDRKRIDPRTELEAVLLIGAGEAGVMVAREISARPDLGFTPIGFLDDDPRKFGMRIGGLPVLGPTSQIKEIAGRRNVKRAMITIANASGTTIRRIALACREADLETKIIPGIYEIVGERVNLSRIRPVAIEDLLGRDPVQLDETQVASSIAGQVVMVTGAGGSIGSELCRQVCRFAPRRLVLVERFENALFEIHRELLAAFPHLAITPRIADVCDAPRMAEIFGEDRPRMVFHAAAHKHVPMMEENPGEAIKNNIGGTRKLADLADRFGVDRFVLISTDKAVNPTSVMGATKRVAEIYTQALSHRSKTHFITVRFGNVLGSNGSVIPIFKEQIARGGPVMVTHPEMERYFMTIPEASQLVMQAGAMGKGGEIFILDMGKPVKIVDLARDLIVLSGLHADDVQIEFVGIRPGEKLFEELATDSEHADKTAHPKIFIGRVRPMALDEAVRGIDKLLELSNETATDFKAALRGLVPEYAKVVVPTTPIPLSSSKATGSQRVIPLPSSVALSES